MKYFELEKNLAHLQILIKQNHTEVEKLELDTSGDCPAIMIYYENDDFSKLLFSSDEDALNIYRRILDDILDTYFVKSNTMI